MLSMFKDKKGFSGLFNKHTDVVADQCVTDVAPRMSGRMVQLRCQWCWKNFAIPSGSPVEEYMCWRCDYPTCLHCREQPSLSLPWTCCGCAQPRSLMKLFSKARYGTDIVVVILAYCDSRSERILKSFFRAAAIKFAATPRVISARPTSAQRTSKARKSGSGLSAQSVNHTNQHPAMQKASTCGSGGLSNAAKHRSSALGNASPLQINGGTPPRVLEENVVDGMRMPTIGTEDPDGVIEYSPCARVMRPAGGCGGGGDVYGSDVSSAALRGGNATAANSAFARERPFAAACVSDAERTSGAGARISRTDGERLSLDYGADESPEGMRFGSSPSPARSESPAPRFPTFAQFLDDQQTVAAQQQLQLQGYGAGRGYASSGQSISVSTATDEDDEEDCGCNNAPARADASRRTGGPRASDGPRRRVTQGGTPRGSGSRHGLGKPSQRRSLEVSSAKKAIKRSSSALTPRGSLQTAGARPSGRRTTTARTSGSRGGGSINYTTATTHDTPPLAPLSSQSPAARPEQLSRTDQGFASYNTHAAHTHNSNSNSPAFRTPGGYRGSSGDRTPMDSARSGFMRCDTATRLSYGSAGRDRRRPAGVRGGPARRPQSAILVRPTSAAAGGMYQRQNSRNGPAFGRTNSTASPLARTASSNGYMRQGTNRTHLTGGGGGGPRPVGLTRTGSSNAGRFGRTASSNRFMSPTAGSRPAMGGYRPGGFRPGAASPLARTDSRNPNPSCGPPSFARTRSGTAPFSRTNSAATPFARTQSAAAAFTRTKSASAALSFGRTASGLPSRLAGPHASNPRFGRSHTSTYGFGLRSGQGPPAAAARPATPNNGASRYPTYGRTPSRFERRPTTNTSTASASAGVGSRYGCVPSTAAGPMLTRGTPPRAAATAASPMARPSPLRRLNTAAGRPGYGGRPSAVAAPAATASDRARLVRTPTQTRFDRQPTRTRHATPTAAHTPGPSRPGKTVESAPMLVHVTRRRTAAAGGVAAPAAAPRATTTTTTTTATTGVAPTRRLSGLVRASAGPRRSSIGGGVPPSPTPRPLAQSTTPTPRPTRASRASRASTGTVTSLIGSDSPRPAFSSAGSELSPSVRLSGVGRTAAGKASSSKTPTSGVRNPTPTGNVFQRLNTGTQRLPTSPSPKTRTVARADPRK